MAATILVTNSARFAGVVAPWNPAGAPTLASPPTPSRALTPAACAAATSDWWSWSGKHWRADHRHSPRRRREAGRPLSPAAASSNSALLDRLDLRRFELEVEAGQVLLQVRRARAPGEREHAGLEREAEHHLGRSAAGASSGADDGGGAQLARIRGQQREA